MPESSAYGCTTESPGVEFFIAAFVRHASARHSHQTYALGVIEDGVQTFHRGELIDRFESLSIEQAAMASIHPRTRLRMRIVDLCAFTADHDDYHLSRISELKRMFAG